MELIDSHPMMAQRDTAPACDSGAGQWLPEDSAGIFASGFERLSFRFAHGLADHPLFSLSNLVALARRRPDNLDFAYWSNGPVDPQDRWEKGMDATQPLAETLAGIAGNDSLVMLRHLEDDPYYGPLMCRLFGRLVELCGSAMQSDVVLGRATIIVASPRRVTPYHIDPESNFLLQLRGCKQLSVFDHHDHSLTSAIELENFFAGDFNGAVYKHERQAGAVVYELGPGDGVHIPATAPHWGSNGDGVSVALSLACDLRSGYRRAKLHQVNRRLRRHGIRPRPPGMSRWGDQLKLAGKDLSIALRALLGRRADPSLSWGWRPRPRRG